MCVIIEFRRVPDLLSTVLSMNPFSLYWKSSWAVSSLASPPGDTTGYGISVHKCSTCAKERRRMWRARILTFVGDAGGITEAAAVTEGLDGGVLVAERLHMCILPS